jgi:hypothetical protein
MFGSRKEKPVMNRALRIIAICALAMSVVAAALSSAAYGQIICNKFTIVTDLRGAALDISLQTDLPDSTVLMVSVSRSYLEEGNTTTYSCDYLSEASTVGKWKTKQTVMLDNQKWRETLRVEQEKMSRLGAGFDVASISEKVNVCMVVPINQTDPRFGKENVNLSGKRVSEVTFGLFFRGVEEEVELTYPMQSPPVGKSPFPNLDPLNLEKGQAYVVSEQTPLMPEFEPADPLGALQRVKQIPKSGSFKVYEIRKKGSFPWYRVVAIDKNKRKIGSGWINSGALLGQELKPYN